MAVNSIGLNGALWMGSQALTANQIAIQTTGNNISNINTPGYARQRANFATDSQNGTGGEVDMGTQVSDIENLTSNLLNSLVQQSLGAKGYADRPAYDAVAGALSGLSSVTLDPRSGTYPFGCGAYVA